MNNRILIFLIIVTCCFTNGMAQSNGQIYSNSAGKTDSWVATDALGRELPTYEQVGDKRTGKLVGMFYYVWHGYHSNEIYDITKLLKKNPENPAYGPEGKFHFWGEPEYGYFNAGDPFVLRHDMQMLANADIDFIFFDVTNNYTYLKTAVFKLCEISLEMRGQGIRTPEIAFLSNTKSGRVMNELYDELYSKGLYQELWFYWQGKPLVMGKTDDPVLRPEVADFFTIKRSWAWTQSYKEPDHWQWLDHYPQDYGWSKSRFIPEQISVSSAHHPGNPLGKSYHDGKQPPVNEDYLTEYTDIGLQFQEQWDRAHEVDPQVVMVTQWNEWIAQRFVRDRNKDTYAGRPWKKGDSWFVDVFTREFNRDIAPMKGGYTDNYYYQLIANVRKFKGMEKPQEYSSPDVIQIDYDFSDWQAVTPVYYDHAGDVMHRDYQAYDSTLRYTNKTGRNDIIESRATDDGENIYFYVKTKEDLTSSKDKNWMLLFIDTDQNKATGWEGYDFIVNKDEVSNNKTSLKKWNGNNWVDVTSLDIAFDKNQMEISIPVEKLGTRSFDFHWADNPQHLEDISAFFLDGDSAPDRRFDYRYEPGKGE